MANYRKLAETATERLQSVATKAEYLASSKEAVAVEQQRRQHNQAAVQPPAVTRKHKHSIKVHP